MKNKGILLTFILFIAILINSSIVFAAILPLGHSSYDDLDRLVVAGFLDMAPLSIRPIDRRQAAKLVIGVIKKIRNKDFSYQIYFRSLEDTVLRLVDELNLEITEIAPGMFDSKRKTAQLISSLISLEKRINYSNSNKKASYSLPNSLGRRLQDSSNIAVIAKGDFDIGQTLGIGHEPVWYSTKDDQQLFLRQWYVNTVINDVSITVGRWPMWYGPGYHGSLLLSNNSLPFDTVEFKNQTPFLLPGFLEYLGSWNFQFFLSRLEKDREFPRVSLIGTRLEVYPISIIGLGLNHTAMFGGHGNGGLNGENFIENFIANGAGSAVDTSNHLASIDIQVVLPAYLQEYFLL
ncbi:MAG: hypothetical protein KAR20_28545, partial [Candidatus Heimdallarchaeota archaeon]|nr:hypothetical protein [Candidatus Heimdallarchaeota archaeon]